MKTLYDLLGALPDDDAESLRTAFRTAVKGAHPDIRPGDPDAGLKFRQIIRANEILRDPDQRAAYDHLMDLAKVEQDSATKYVIANRIYKLAFGIIGLAGGSVATIGVYLLLLHLTGANLPPQGEPEAAARAPVEVAALARSESESNPQPIRDDTATGAPADAIAPHVVTSQTIAETVSGTLGAAANEGDASETLRARGINAYRNGDLDGAIADLDQAIQLNPKFAAAYIDRGIVLYRMQKFDRALADVARAKQIEGKRPDKSGHTKPESVVAKSEGAAAKPEAAAAKPESVVTKKQRSAQVTNPIVLTPVSQRPTIMTHDASRDETGVFLRMR